MTQQPQYSCRDNQSKKPTHNLITPNHLKPFVEWCPENTSVNFKRVRAKRYSLDKNANSNPKKANDSRIQ